MTSTWWLITSAAAFGWAVTFLPLAYLMRPLAARDVLMLCEAPGGALTAQGLVLWAAGTSVAGTAASFAAGLAVAAVSVKILGRKS